MPHGNIYYTSDVEYKAPSLFHLAWYFVVAFLEKLQFTIKKAIKHGITKN